MAYVWHDIFECWLQAVLVFRPWKGEIVAVWCTLGSAPPRQAPPRGGRGDEVSIGTSMQELQYDV